MNPLLESLAQRCYQVYQNKMSTSPWPALSENERDLWRSIALESAAEFRATQDYS